MRLIEAPIGLFKHGNCVALKTEYMVNGAVEAYIVSSGERFWGGAKNAEELNNLEVTPIERKDFVPQGEWVWNEECECWCCSRCEASALNNYRGLSVDSNFCPNCGARMRGK